MKNQWLGYLILSPFILAAFIGLMVLDSVSAARR
jgi:hypothetical protein